jgi:hypothetical protein
MILRIAAVGLTAATIAAGAVLWWIWGPAAALAMLAQFCL